MSSRIFSAVAVALLLITSVAHGRDSSGSTVEAFVADSDVVIRATVDAIGVEAGTITLSTIETIKGEVRQRFIIPGFANDELVLARRWLKDHTEVLAFLVKSDRRPNEADLDRAYTYLLMTYGRPPSIFELVDRLPKWRRSIVESSLFTTDYKTAEFRELLKVADLLSAARAYVKFSKAAVNSEFHLLDVIQEDVFRRLHQGGGVTMGVPVDARLRELADRWFENKEGYFRIEAVRIFVRFKDDDSIAKLKRALKDDAHTEISGKEGDRYLTRHSYGGRQLAWETLKEWGIVEKEPEMTKVVEDRPLSETLPAKN